MDEKNILGKCQTTEHREVAPPCIFIHKDIFVCDIFSLIPILNHVE